MEKPLCLSLKELNKIKSLYKSSNILMVGFNRRFAPQIKRIKGLLSNINEPKSFIMTINAGYIPKDHWTQDLEIGGGRIIGEACHFIDLLRFLAGEIIVESKIQIMDGSTKDTVSIQLSFLDGSIGSIHFFSNGSKSLPKERLEVYAKGGVLQLDNYRKLTGYGWPSFKNMNLWQQDKGQMACSKAFIDAITQGSLSPIPIDEIFEVSEITIKLANQ